MFTGLIEDVGQVRDFSRRHDGARLLVATALPIADMQLGESIAVNGVCLTVTSLGDEAFSADISPETLSCSTLSGLRSGNRVNLERALRLGDRLGGHLVCGHVDGIARLVDKRRDGNAMRMTFRLPPEYLQYLVVKGSVAIDGVSLTVNLITGEDFSVAVIPHSLVQTTLDDCKIGGSVNVETDMIAKYVQRLFPGHIVRSASAPAHNELDLDMLAKHGFL
ncbi:MAG: riboflavin synthase subunit alpha [Desulfuromonadales bacterium GWD2_61_12]|nr:MAG: riboflavin synthase subunit alpha [Desulfuromonadales bacterium GWD2_61_12]HAD04545.1 riboflavin synthase [Desulfuromonas sp.]